MCLKDFFEDGVTVTMVCWYDYFIVNGFKESGQLTAIHFFFRWQQLIAFCNRSKIVDRNVSKSCSMNFV